MLSWYQDDVTDTQKLRYLHEDGTNKVYQDAQEFNRVALSQLSRLDTIKQHFSWTFRPFDPKLTLLDNLKGLELDEQRKIKLSTWIIDFDEYQKMRVEIEAFDEPLIRAKIDETVHWGILNTELRDNLQALSERFEGQKSDIRKRH